MGHRSPVSSSARGTRVVVDGRELVSFAGCDTLGLARHPDVIAAARDALDRCGLSATASRVTTGTWTPHVDLERALAAWFETEDAVLLPSGWAAPAAVASALAPECDVALLDEGAHPALAAAVRATGLDVRAFEHFDPESARRAVEPGARPLVAVCAIDMLRGVTAPIDALLALVEGLDGHLLTDDAHGVGVLGPSGRGVTDGHENGRLHRAGSLAKALGAHGGFTVGTRTFCDAVRARADVYTGGTPLPPAVAAGALRALEIASTDDSRRHRVLANAERLTDAVAHLGLRTPSALVPWFSFDGFPAERLDAASRRLADAGLLVPHLRYPGSPPDGLLRVTLSAAHSDAHLDRLIDGLRREFGQTAGGAVPIAAQPS